MATTATRHATLGTCVLQLPMRSPAAVARSAHTLQLLSGGRFVLGLGVGSHPGEYNAAEADYRSRGRRLDDGIEVVRDAWARHGDPDDRYRMEPPVPAPPIWLAGTSDAALGRAARVGDGWVPLFTTPTDYRSALDRLLDAALGYGREPEAIDTAVVVVVCVGDNEEVARKEGTSWLSDLYSLPPRAFERHLIAGPAEDCAAAISGYHEAGARHVVVMVAADETLDHFGPLAEAASLDPLGAAP